MKYLLLFAFLFVSVTIFAQTPQEPSLGSGTSADPYQIDNFENLLWVRQETGTWGLHFIQTANIDASPSSLLYSGAGWSPIGNGSPAFSGTYDGQGFEIQGLTFSRGTLFYGGLFGYLNGAKLSRIHLRSVNLFGSTYLGGIAGVVSNSVINSCSVTGVIHGSNVVGGLTGYYSYGTVITNSYSHASVQAGSNVGGFAGQSHSDNPGFIYHSYSTGQVICSDWSKGGFVGTYGANIYDCYWDTQSSGIATDNMAIPKTTSQMQQQATFEYWNFDTLWSIQEGVSYPDLSPSAAYSAPLPVSLSSLPGTGTESDPYLISTAAELSTMSQGLDKWFRLTDDIDLSSTIVWDHGQGWLPVGSSSTPFIGGLDGDGHSLLNLVINRPRRDQTGLFAKTVNCTIRNIDLINARVMGKDYCGSLVGDASGGMIEHIHVSGSLLPGSYGGGIAGRIDSGTLQRSFTQVTIKTQFSYTGGLAGVLSSTGIISGTISECSGSGAIIGNWHVGGIVGSLSWGYVNDCYSHSDVYGGFNIGGIAGISGGTNPGYINRCFATGLIELSPSGSWSGGIVGSQTNGDRTLCYYDTQTTGLPDNQINEGRTTSQMTYPGSIVTFGAWDFSDTWRQDSQGLQNSGYPYLSWQEVALPDAVPDLMVSVSGGEYLLEWQPVLSVSSYNVYSSENPYAPWDQWTYLGQSTATSFTTIGGSRLFFMVRSVRD